jgi:hypothetical protein
MARIMSFKSLGGEITSGPQSGMRALAKLRGTGLPPVATQWFEGAGDGASYRGGRLLARVLDVPIKVYGNTENEVAASLGLIGRIFALTAGDVRLTIDRTGQAWYVDVRRTGGGDWEWGEDSDGSSYVMTVLTVQAGDPYWTAVTEQSRVVAPNLIKRGLITPGGSLSKLQLATGTAFGAVEFSNDGDVPAYPEWTLTAPFAGFNLISGTGEAVRWSGGKQTGHLIVNTKLGTITDETGKNAYAGLAPAPRFWPIQPGESQATVELVTAQAGAQAVALWHAKRWVMF